MLHRSKIRALVLLVAIFVAGGAVGWLGHEGADRGSSHGRRRSPDAMVDHLAMELELTPAQRDSVRAIFQRRREDTRVLWEELRPRYAAIRERVNAEISAQLTPAQNARFRVLNEEMERAHDEADKRRGKHGGRP